MESEFLRPGVFPASGRRTMRVALLAGCAQQALDRNINAATIRLLQRHGCDVVVAQGAGCCGALPLHMGRDAQGRRLARANIAAWSRAFAAGLDAVVVNASGCGTTVKDYGHMFADDPTWHDRAVRVASLARDVSELMVEVGLANVTPKALSVAYHSACSMQHGQKLTEQPKKLLRDAGFVVKDVPEGHLCCGWAGTYQVLQPELSRRLRDRKVANIESVRPDVIASGNFGCVGNIGAGTTIPIVHTVELLDWATGGPKPAGLQR
jgi:glycolate oxidase iron-sulfur subunit